MGTPCCLALLQLLEEGRSYFQKRRFPGATKTPSINKPQKIPLLKSKLELPINHSRCQRRRLRMDLISDEVSGISNAGWTGREDIVSLYQILPVIVGPVVKRGFFMPRAIPGFFCLRPGVYRLELANPQRS